MYMWNTYTNGDLSRPRRRAYADQMMPLADLGPRLHMAYGYGPRGYVNDLIALSLEALRKGAYAPGFWKKMQDRELERPRVGSFTSGPFSFTTLRTFFMRRTGSCG